MATHALSSLGYKVIAILVVFFLGMQFLLNFSSYNYQHHFNSVQDMMMPPVIPAEAAAALSSDSNGRRKLSAAVVSSFHLHQDMEAEKLPHERNPTTYGNINHTINDNSSHSCPVIPPKLGE